MSDQSRYPFSSASGRLSQSFARPDWPWVRNYSHNRSHQSSPSPSLQGSSYQRGQWASSARPSSSSSITRGSYSESLLGRTAVSPSVQGLTQMAPTTESTRQWSFTGFEWDIHNVAKLRDFVEGIESTEYQGQQSSKGDAGNFEILTKSPVLGDNKFKLEIVLPESLNSTDKTDSVPALSLYITTLMLDYADDDFEINASMMVAVKCQNDRIGERGARPDWVWEFWQNDWVFRTENEVWECPLPSLSKLLENERIHETDSLVICVQIHSPGSPVLPHHPSVYYVPRDLLDGLEASLDNPNTADVQFICLEKGSNNQLEIQDLTSGPDPASPPAVARKRIIYAHSDILIRRSDYFATMLSSSFCENSFMSSESERKLSTVIVEEADFQTIYWLLKYCYANWLLFQENDDPRAAVEGGGWSARWLYGSNDEWGWKQLYRGGPSEEDTSDNKSATSSEAAPFANKSANKNTEISQSSVSVSKAYSPPLRGSKPNTAVSGTLHATATMANNPSRRFGPPQSPVEMGALGSGLLRPQTTVASNSTTFTPASGHINSHSPKHLKALGSPDPHLHPTPPPPPASALSIYQIAHRYIMPNLAALAMEHIMSTITPQSSFAILLATAPWEDLHSSIEDFVVDKWDDVCMSKGFEDCCNEIAAGEWGLDGGKTLTSVFRRLRPPGP